MGQRKATITIRFYIKNSFEEVLALYPFLPFAIVTRCKLAADCASSTKQQVMDVQQSKKELEDISLSPHDGGLADSSIRRLQVGVTADPGSLGLMTDVWF